MRLCSFGGDTLFESIDRPSGGMPTEAALLRDALENGDWADVSVIVSRLAPRLIGDQSGGMPFANNSEADAGAAVGIDDPTLSHTAPQYYAGGGRLGLDRDTFVLSGGVPLLLRVFREPDFIGEVVGRTNDARDLSEEIVTAKLAGCWNEVLASLREMAYAMPHLVDDGSDMLEDGDFVPFLFTLLAHNSCFDGAAALIEEILSLQSQAPGGGGGSGFQPAPASTFYLGDVPGLYNLWGNFTCRQLAHFCRILALLVFEPEDRQLMESPAVLKSVELLQLRRDRAARAGRDSAVDQNQAILLGDGDLVNRLLKLLRVMNYAPDLSRSLSYHVMAHFPWIADTLVMLGLIELEDWDDVDALDVLARTMLVQGGEHGMTLEQPPEDGPTRVSDLGSIADMIESLSGELLGGNVEGGPGDLLGADATHFGHVIHVINAAQRAGVIVGRHQAQSTSNNSAGGFDNSRGGVGRSHSQTERDTASNAAVATADTRQVENPLIRVTSVPLDGTSVGNFENTAAAFTEQVLFRRVYNPSDTNGALAESGGVDVETGTHGLPGTDDTHFRGRQQRIEIPEDAANELQFNALLLAPYQVEILFVLCTLLGGRRKIDAQTMLGELGIVRILNEMFDRLSWGPLVRPSPQGEMASSLNMVGNGMHGANTGQSQEEHQNGIHGPGM